MKAQSRPSERDDRTVERLPREEWDFRSLFHSAQNEYESFELQAATIYEYARESASIRALAVEYAALPKPLRNDIEEQCCLTVTAVHPSRHPVSDNLIWLESLHFWNCILWPKYFPGMPWLSIPDKQRRRRIDAWVTANSCKIFRRHGCEEMQGWPPMTEGSRSFSGNGEHILGWINWKASDNEIANAFKIWVNTNRPLEFPNPHTAKDRQLNKNARLKWLGIMRLLNQHSRRKAGKMWDQAADNEPAFKAYPWPSDEKNVGRERGFVKRDLRQIFKSDAFKAITGKPLIPDDEIPIHWEMVG